VVGATEVATASATTPAISPRALKLAEESDLDPAQLTGSGPGGRIIERDVRAALAARPQSESVRMTPVAKAMIERGGFVAPEHGSGPGGRITKADLAVAAAPDYDVIALPNIRRVIAERMRGSVHGTAQLTMTASADARALLAYRKRLKDSDAALGLRDATINDLVLLAVAKTLPEFPQLNATFSDGELRQFKPVHLGFAVDTPRGLLVPVIRDAHTHSLRVIARESSRLAQACQAGTVPPDVLAGGTFTVTNLGQFGIESFTPILNVPQVAILGVGNVTLRAIDVDGVIQHVPHLGLSLTIDHQIVDGAPGAKFLQALARGIAGIDLLVAA
jgi:pyruvate dehydrogenase E2 component (dihydrolipoamide acetyltransferase)